MSTEYQFRCRCHICSVNSPWYETVGEAKPWRQKHFTTKHADNPMMKENAPIQRYPTGDIHD